MRLHDLIACAPDDPSPLTLEQQLGHPTFEHRRRRLRQFAGTRTRRILEIGCAARRSVSRKLPSPARA